MEKKKKKKKKKVLLLFVKNTIKASFFKRKSFGKGEPHVYFEFE